MPPSEGFPKYIVVTGGVMSGVGKGLATASIAKILQQYGFRTTAVKIDPYINYDAGTLRPTEHGEVWVTDDGGEIDQDLGSYERFLGSEIPRTNNITTGQIYKTVIDRERRGEYLGVTVQFIPHIIDEIKRRVRDAAEGFDIALVEIGGTVGDYENIPFLFAMKSLEREIGEKNIIYVLITYLPVPSHINEMKTKPTQQAIKMLSENGIFPDFILCRAKKPLDQIRKKKIETYVNIDAECIVSAPDEEVLYSVPLNFERESLGLKILRRFALEPRTDPDWRAWERLVSNIRNPSRRVRIAVVGKYVEIGDYSLPDSYISVNQALLHSGAQLQVGVDISWIDASKLEECPDNGLLHPFDGIVVPGGFGVTGVEGKMRAIRYARESGVPFLGLCYGMHLAVIEYARTACGLREANSTEIDPQTSCPIVDVLPSQKALLEKHEYGGTMRLGAYAAMLAEGSSLYRLYLETGRLEEDQAKLARILERPHERFRAGILEEGVPVVLERHRHRYEVTPDFVEPLEKQGLVFSGHHVRGDGTKLVEFLELPGHPSFVATQAHPEFKSRLGNSAPLFLGFVRAAARRKEGTEGETE